MDPTANNYNPDAMEDDGSCMHVYGCTNEEASNYNFEATREDDSCILSAPGCLDDTASNFDATATEDSGECIYEGCTDTLCT